VIPGPRTVLRCVTPIFTPRLEGTRRFRSRTSKRKSVPDRNRVSFTMKLPRRLRQGLCFGQLSSGEIQNTTPSYGFWMVEPEMAYARLEDVMVLPSECFHIAARVLEERGESKSAGARQTN